MIEDKKIVALNFAVEDGMTGASAAYHVVEHIGADYRNGYVTATLNAMCRKMRLNRANATCWRAHWIFRKRT